MKLIAMKFGGTSVGSAEAITQVKDIVRDTLSTESENVLVVVSALNGVTNLLQEGLVCAASGDEAGYQHVTEALRERHWQVIDNLLDGEADPLLASSNELIDGYLRFCESVHVLGEAPPRALDYTMGLGERISARLVAATLRHHGIKSQAVDATDLIVTDDQFQNAAPILDLTEAKVKQGLGPLLNEGIVPIVTGFIAATVDGVSTTLGRGGSDYSAALLGAILNSDEVWIWTDVDGVMSTDPRIVKEARSIERLTYKEVGEMAYFGAKVLHPKTIRPVLEADIPLRVKNTFNPTHPGTLITPNDLASDHPIKAVTVIREMSLITVEGKGMLGVPGIAARTFGAVARTGKSVLIISQSSSEQSICFVVPRAASGVVVKALREEFVSEIARRDIDQTTSRDDVAIVTVVGAGMLETPGIAGRIFTATGSNGVNVIAIAQGSSECGISLVVTDDDADLAVRAIHVLALADN
ncbi:MAG: aspartate kinase [Anaerolineae bacterium]|nr:aspartate kinase [Anaerolineae bacterium]